MKWRMEANESEQGGAVTPDIHVQAMRVRQALEQFDTRSCARCTGLLVNEWCYDLDNSGESLAAVLRCVQCGHRIDPVIIQHQVTPGAEDRPYPGHQPPVSVVLAGQTA